MLLTLDIGNTNIKSALFNGNTLIEFIIHSKFDEVIKYTNSKSLNCIAVCSVNPSTEKILVKDVSKKGIQLFQANINNKFNLKIKYKTPDTLGMDRVCSTIAAYHLAVTGKMMLKNQHLITIDFGTATTLNVVSPEGYFIGGLIAPGIYTMLKSLNEKTAQLPLSDLVSYEGLIGNSTSSSILSGVYTSTIGMINETVNQLSEINNCSSPIIFATGGNAESILPHVKHTIFYEEALVLKGLKIIYDLNK
ncbi:MAG: type III pantothenate kinase [Ignavibacteriaceae bacterium]